MNLYKVYGPTFIPFRLRQERGLNSRCVLGGEPPVGVSPRQVAEQTRYLGTLGLEAGVDVSLFSTFNYETQDSPFSFFGGTCKLQDQASSLVQFVVHNQTSEKAVDSPLRSEIPTLGFAFGSPSSDPVCATLPALGDPQIFNDHKAGGVPYFSQIEGDMGAVLKIMDKGYVHLLQLVFPSNEDTLINVDWPFGESVFHVFAKKTGGVFEFRYIWA